MFKYLTIIFLVLTFFTLNGCRKDVAVEDINAGYNYFPAEKGYYVIYKADSIVYNDFTGTIDTFSFELKEIIESLFTDAEGRTAQRIERYKRLSDTLPWTISNVWYSVRTASAAEKVEDNVRFMKLSFPVKKNKKWNGNVYNVLNEKTYKYTSVDVPYQNQYLSFDSSATVLQDDFATLISTDYAVEIYARNAGLVYKKYVYLNKEITGNIKKGVDYTLIAKETGIE